jgi:hypothetical protein
VPPGTSNGFAKSNNLGSGAKARAEAGCDRSDFDPSRPDPAREVQLRQSRCEECGLAAVRFNQVDGDACYDRDRDRRKALPRAKVDQPVDSGGDTVHEGEAVIDMALKARRIAVPLGRQVQRLAPTYEQVTIGTQLCFT